MEVTVKTETFDKKALQKVLNYIPFFTNICERDYITYNDDHSFEYTPAFFEFIKTLYEANLVEDYEVLNEFIENYQKVENCTSKFNLWMQDMNKTICRPDLLIQADIDFLRKALMTLIRLESIIPGSWGIDIEVGTWLKLLRRIKGLSEEMVS